MLASLIYRIRFMRMCWQCSISAQPLACTRYWGNCNPYMEFSISSLGFPTMWFLLTMTCYTELVQYPNLEGMWEMTFELWPWWTHSYTVSHNTYAITIETEVPQTFTASWNTWILCWHVNSPSGCYQSWSTSQSFSLDHTQCKLLTV